MRCDHTLIEMGVRGDGSKDGEKWTDLKYILKTGWIGTLCGSLGPIQTGRCQCQLLIMTKGKNSWVGGGRKYLFSLC